MSSDSYNEKTKKQQFAEQRITMQYIAEQYTAPITRCIALVLLCAICVSITSACGIVPGQSYTFEDAALAGVIIDRESDDLQEQQPDEYTIVTATIQELVDRRNLQTLLFFPVEDDLFFNHYEGEVTILVEEGEFVTKGDLLATLSFDTDERHYINYEAAVAHLERLEQEFSRERARRRNEISRARGTLPAQAVRLMEIELERYNFINSLTVADLEEEISNLRMQLGIEEITAPYDGMVFFVFEGGTISLGTTAQRIMRIADPNDFFFQIAISTTHSLATHYNIIGHGDIITLRERTDSDAGEGDSSHSRIEFETRVVTDSWAAGQRQAVMYLLKPVDMDGLIDTLLAIDGGNPIITLRSLHLSAQVEYTAAPKGITLPTAALQREHIRDQGDVFLAEQRYVLIYVDGKVEKRNVEIGETVGGYTHIITGIDEDAKVVILH